MSEIKLEVKQAEKGPDMIKEINGVTYVVRAHFREGAGEYKCQHMNVQI